mmetsp:Transcript_7689/g.23282  ORF Transcript_7689/g.23282 Transcript_7689/m.23282 type:complete len:295 (+) Transcript_7689:77-961(+)
MAFVGGVRLSTSDRRSGCRCCCESEGKLTRRQVGLALVSIVAGAPAAAFANKGGKDRCDAIADLECGPDGVKLSEKTVYDAPSVTSYAVTDKVYFEVYAAGVPIGRIVVGVFRDAAPKSADIFVRMCEGTFKDLSYASSQVFRVEKDRRIDMGRLSKGMGKTEVRSIDYSGYVRKKYLNTADEATLNRDANELKHNAAGLVSMQKGGGSFEFVIPPPPKPDPTLDADHIIIGQVLEGMTTISKLNSLPVNKPTGYRDTFIKMGKAINDKRATAAEDDVFKPLQKTVVKSVGVIR